MAGFGGILKAVLTLDNKQFNDGLKKSQKQTETFGKSVGKIGGLVAGAFSAAAVIQFGKEIAIMNRHLYNADIAFKRLGGGDEYMEDLRRSTGYMIDDLKLMQQVIQATNLGLQRDDLPTYFRFATIRAAETGVAVEYLTNSIISGIGRQSRLVLDNLGISLVDLNAEIAKTGDFVTAAVSLMNKELRKAGREVDDVTIGVSQLGTEWQNTIQNIASSDMAEDLDDMSGSLADILRVFNKLSKIEIGGKTALGAIFGSSFLGVGLEYTTLQLELYADALNAILDAFKEAEKLDTQSYMLNALYGIAPFNGPVAPEEHGWEKPMPSDRRDFMPSFNRVLTQEEKAYVQYFEDYTNSLYQATMLFKDLEDVDIELPAPSEEDIEAWRKANLAVTEFGMTLADVAAIGITSMAGAISDLVSGGDPLNVLKNFLSDLGNMLMMYGASLIALGVGEELATKGGPWGAIVGGGIILAAGAALAAIGGAMDSSISGGAYSGGGSYSGSYAGGSSGYGGSYDYNREITMVARGEDLVSVINRQNYRDGNYG